MRFVEVIVVYIILCFLEIVFCTGILSYRKIANECEAKKMEYSSTKFISESFKNTCAGKGFKNLEEWQKTCRALWKLDYIGWARKGYQKVVLHLSRVKHFLFHSLP